MIFAKSIIYSLGIWRMSNINWVDGEEDEDFTEISVSPWKEYLPTMCNLIVPQDVWI